MRIKVNFTKNTEPVDRNLKHIVSWMNKVLGDNNVFHDMKEKPYSISPMLGGKAIKERVGYENFVNGGSILINLNDPTLYGPFMENVINVDFGFGMKYDSISMVDHMSDFLFYDNTYIQTTKNGILLYDDDGNNKPITFSNDPNWLDKLKKQTLKKVLALNPNIDTTGFDIRMITETNLNNYTTKITYKDFYYHTSVVGLILNGSRELKELIYKYGLGHCRSQGMGMVFTTNLFRDYILERK